MATDPLSPISSASTHPSCREDDEDGIKTDGLIADTQLNRPPHEAGFFQSLVVNAETQGGHTMPAKNFGITHIKEYLIRKTFPACVRNFQGLRYFGDLVEQANTEEGDAIMALMKRLEGVDPRYRIRQFAIGNHDVRHVGTGRSGWDFFGAMGIILNLLGPRSYQKDIYAPQVGGMDHRLTKEKLIRDVLKMVMGGMRSPVRLVNNDPWHYRTFRGERSSWDDSRGVVRDFWKRGTDGTWTALVDYRPDGRVRDPEERWLFTQVARLNEVRSPQGSFSTYLISLDTMDLLTGAPGMSANLGANDGHVSAIQVRLIAALMEEIKKVEPNAKFIVGAHYPATMIAGMHETGLFRILEDPSVVAFINGHTHHRGLEDLTQGDAAKKLTLRRSEPLYQITVPSLIDHPAEMVLFRHGIEKAHPDRLVYEFNYSGIEGEPIPGDSNAVQGEFNAIRNRLNIYEPAIEHIKDPKMREFSDPSTRFWRRVDLAANLDTGMMVEEGAIHDQIIAKDVIFGMVEDVKLYLRLSLGAAKLQLIETGHPELADRLARTYLPKIEELDRYYEDIWRRTSSKTLEHGFEMPPQQPLHPSVDPLVADLRAFMVDYKNWLVDFEQKSKREAHPNERVHDANLFGRPSFGRLWKTMLELPYGSQASAFLIKAYLESSKQGAVFYKGSGALKKNVPSQIRIEVSTADGRITLVKSGASSDAGTLPETGPAHLGVFGDGDRGVAGHMTAKIGGFHRSQSDGVSLEAGITEHVLNRWDRPRLDVNFGLRLDQSVASQGAKENDVSINLGIGVGDPWGWATLGPVVLGGMSLQGSKGLGLGGQLTLLEQSLSVEIGHEWRQDRANGWRFSVNVDPLALHRIRGLIDW